MWWAGHIQEFCSRVKRIGSRLSLNIHDLE
jgi:hypothetical protein